MGEISPAIIQILQKREIVRSPKGASVDKYNDTACGTYPWVFFRKALTTSLTPRLICFLLAPFLANFNTFLQSLSSASGLAITLIADFFAMAPSAIANKLPNCVHQCDSCCTDVPRSRGERSKFFNVNPRQILGDRRTHIPHALTRH